MAVGSRARGERPGDEGSDVDPLVVVEDASWDGKGRVHAALAQAAGELGLESMALSFSLQIDASAWLAQCREIRSFFVTEIDRDKGVLYEATGS